MRGCFGTLAVALILLGGYQKAAAQPPFSHQYSDLEGPALGLSLAGSLPLGQQVAGAEPGVSFEFPVAHAVSVRTEVGSVGWTMPETAGSQLANQDVSLRRFGIVLIQRHHRGPHSYMGVGLGSYRYRFSDDPSMNGRYRGLQLLGGVERLVSRKVAVALEAQGHLIAASKTKPAPALSLVFGFAIRAQWRY